MKSGKYAFCTPASLIRRSMSACMRSQMAYPTGRITMVPRTGPLSASCALAIRSWYQRGKSSARSVSTRAMTRHPSRGRRATGREGIASPSSERWLRGMDFDAFYRDTSRRLLRYAYGLTGDPVEAQDLVQEAYARAWQRWKRLRAEAGAGAGVKTAGAGGGPGGWAAARAHRAARGRGAAPRRTPSAGPRRTTGSG